MPRPTENIRQYVKTHSRKDSLLYNNRLFFGTMHKTSQVEEEYTQNRLFILQYFGY